MIAIRLFECVLIDWRTKQAELIKSKRPTIKEKELTSLVKNLELNPRNIPFSNKTSWTLRNICDEDGEHFTPREIIRLMVRLLDIPLPKKHTSIYNPACGTGGMLSVAKEHLLDQCKTEKEQQDVENLFSRFVMEYNSKDLSFRKLPSLMISPGAL